MSIEEAPLATFAKKIIIFNGPPRVGKDLAANAVLHFVKKHGSWLDPQHERFSINMKRAVHAAYGLFHNPEYIDVNNLKDKPHTDLLGLTPRQAYIAMFEHLALQHGENVLGVLMEQQLRRQHKVGLHIFSDGGRFDEIIPIIDYVRPKNVLFIEIHALNRTFEGDIRGYIGDDLQAKYSNKMTMYKIPNTISENPEDKLLFRTLCIGAAKKFLKLEVEEE